MLKAIKLVIVGTIATFVAAHPVNHEVVAQVKQSTTLWTPVDVENNIFANYSEAEIKGLLGTIVSGPVGLPDVEVNQAASDSFDSRTKWPSCVHAIRDQQQCGSCWAFAASEAFSDRLCIAGVANTVVSPQDLVSCDKNNYACDGGYLNLAW